MLTPLTGGGYDIPSKYHTALQAGIRFFILRYPKRTESDHALFGPFDVFAREEVDVRTSRARFDVRWMTTNNAQVVFRVQPGTQNAICYMPDDIYYHNRVILCDQPWIAIEGMHTPASGIRPGIDIRMEIDCLREVLTEKAVIYRVVDPKTNREIDYAWTREEAEEIIAEKRAKRFNGIPVEVQPHKRCIIVEGFAIKKKDSVIQMIARHQGNQFGWTASDEFKREIIPQVDAKIAARKNSAEKVTQGLTAEDARALILNTIASMSEEELQQVRKIPRPAAPVETEDAYPEDAAVSDVESLEPEVLDSDIPQQASVVSGDAPEYKKYELSKKRIDDLKVIAQSLDIVTDGLKRTEIIDAILEKQETFVVS